MVKFKNSKSTCKWKNMLLILMTFSFFQLSYSTLTSLRAVMPTNSINVNQKIKRIQTNIMLDREKESCDLTVSEKVLFSFDKLTTSINHLIFSKRFSIYKIHALISENKDLNENLIIDTKFYSNTNVRKLLFNTIANNDLITNNFKENWVVSIELKNPIKEIEINFIYNIQNGLIVNPIDKTNIFQYDYINAYPISIDNFKLEIEINNYLTLNKYNIRSSQEGLIESFNQDKGLRITLLKQLPELSQYSVSLPLPYEIEICNRALTNAVNIILYSVTLIITILGLITCFKLSKE